MGAITWRDVQAPDYRSAMEGYRQASDLIGKSFSGLSQGVKQYDDTVSDNVNRQFQMLLTKEQDAQGMRDKLTGGTYFSDNLTDGARNRLSSASIQAASQRPEQILRTDTAFLDKDLRGVQLEAARDDLGWNRDFRGHTKEGWAADTAVASLQAQLGDDPVKNAEIYKQIAQIKGLTQAMAGAASQEGRAREMQPLTMDSTRAGTESTRQQTAASKQAMTIQMAQENDRVADRAIDAQAQEALQLIHRTGGGPEAKEKALNEMYAAGQLSAKAYNQGMAGLVAMYPQGVSMAGQAAAEAAGGKVTINADGSATITPTDESVDFGEGGGGGSMDGFINRYVSGNRMGESGGDDSTPNRSGPGGRPASTALGRHQFINGTWIEYYTKTFGRRGMTDAQILATRTNGATQDRVMRTFTQENIANLQAAGIPINSASVYAMHVLGQGANGGGMRFMQAWKAGRGNELATKFMDPAVVGGNKWVAGKTVNQVLQEMGKRMGGMYSPGDGSGEGPKLYKPNLSTADSAISAGKRLAANPMLAVYSINTGLPKDISDQEAANLLVAAGGGGGGKGSKDGEEGSGGGGRSGAFAGGSANDVLSAIRWLRTEDKNLSTNEAVQILMASVKPTSVGNWGWKHSFGYNLGTGTLDTGKAMNFVRRRAAAGGEDGVQDRTANTVLSSTTASLDQARTQYKAKLDAYNAASRAAKKKGQSYDGSEDIQEINALGRRIDSLTQKLIGADGKTGFASEETKRQESINKSVIVQNPDGSTSFNPEWGR